jgi:hypothetical protein
LFKNYADENKYKTRINKLNIIPDKIGIKDVNTILVSVHNLMEKIYENEKQKGRNVLNPNITRIKFEGKRYTFKDFLKLYDLV